MFNSDFSMLARLVDFMCKSRSSHASQFLSKCAGILGCVQVCRHAQGLENVVVECMQRWRPSKVPHWP